MSYMDNWKTQSDAINNIFSHYGKLIKEVDGNWSHTSDNKEVADKKNEILKLRDIALKAQREQYVKGSKILNEKHDKGV